MSNEKFKVKFGLAVGDTVATVDGTTGNIITQGTIDVQGGTVTDSTGTLSITTGASNGNITLDPNGTGNVVMTFANGGNLTNDRNYVSGIIRNTTAAAAGDVWGSNTGTTNPYRGISIDNTASSTTTTGKRTGIIMRNYANAPRNTIIGETARGTNPSSPTQLTNNSNLVELVGQGWAGNSDGSGFTSTGSSISGTTLTVGTVVTGAPAVGQLISSYTPGVLVTTGTRITANISGSGSGSTWTVSNSQTVASSAINGGGDGWLSSVNGQPAALRFTAAENWTSNSSGTSMQVALSPINNTTQVTAGFSATALNMSFNSTNLFSDTYNFFTKPTGAGGTQKNILQLTEATTTATTDTFNINNATTGQQCVTVNTSGGDVVLSVQQQRATTSNDNALVNFSTFRWDGTQYTPTLLQDTIGEFKFNGNVFTGASPGTTTGPGASINAFATENWSPTATGTGFRFNAVRTGTLNSYDVISGNTNSLSFNSDTLNFNSFDSVTNRVSVNGTAAEFNLPIRLNNNVIQAGDGATAITTVPITGFNPNTDFTGNIIKGQLRTGNGESTGDIFQLNGGSASTGISVDNTNKTADRTAVVLRNYANAPRNAVIFEASRGTAASPANLNSGNVLGDLIGTGYTSTGFVTDQIANVPALVRLYATEAWNNGLNNVGSGFRVILQPTATPLTSTSLITALEVTPTNTTMIKQSNVVENRAASPSDYARTNFTTVRWDGTQYTPTESGDSIGEFKYNGNAQTGANFGVPAGPGAAITAKATELWTSTANGTTLNFNAIKTGTIDGYDVIRATPDNLLLNASTINLNTFDESAPLIGNNIVYNRVYGQFEYNTTITPAAANTADVFPIGTATFNNITTVGSTSRIILGAAGIYNLQFSVQVSNADSQEHTAYIWLRKNGVDIPNSTGRVSIIKQGSTITGWNFMIDSANTTDYYEIAYAVSDTNITFPAFSSTAFAPGTASLVTTITPVGA